MIIKYFLLLSVLSLPGVVVANSQIAPANNLDAVFGFTGSESIQSSEIVSGVSATLSALSGTLLANKVVKKGTVTVKAADLEVDFVSLSFEGPTSLSKEGESTHQALSNRLGALDQGSNSCGVLCALAEVSEASALSPRLFESPEALNAVELAFSMVGISANAQAMAYRVNKENGKVRLSGLVSNFNLGVNRLAQDMILAQHQANEILDEAVIETLEMKRTEQFPLIAGGRRCLPISGIDSLTNALLSRTHSSDCDATAKALGALTQLRSAPYVSDVLRILSEGIAQGDDFPIAPSQTFHTLNGADFVVTRTDPLSFIHCQNTEELTQNALHIDWEIGGYYSTEFNVVTARGSHDDGQFVSYFTHESAHAVMNLLFNNDSNPYRADDEHAKERFMKAELACFKILALRLGVSREDLEHMHTTQEVISALVASKNDRNQAELGLSKDEQEIVAQMSSIALDYNPDESHKELIARLPQLVAMGISMTTLEHYLHPLMEYWDNTISSTTLFVRPS